MAEFVLETNYSSKIKYPSETDNSSKYKLGRLTDNPSGRIVRL